MRLPPFTVAWGCPRCTGLPGESDGDGRYQEALKAATRAVVARTDPAFQVNALVAALARIVAGQQEEKATLKRTKVNASALKEAKKQ